MGAGGTVSIEERIDANLDAVLRASGSRLSNYTMPSTLAAMRKAMREIMAAEWIRGTDAGWKASRP